MSPAETQFDNNGSNNWTQHIAMGSFREAGIPESVVMAQEVGDVVAQNTCSESASRGPGTAHQSTRLVSESDIT